MVAFFEYIPLIVFFVFYKMFDVFIATGALIVTSALHLVVMKATGKPILNRHWIFFGLIAVFGGLTIFFHDDTFIKWKVTIINGFFGVALLVSKYAFNKNLLESFMGEQLKLPDAIWSKFNLAWVGFFFTCAFLNLYIAFSFDQETWVNFKVFGLTGLTFAFAIVSIMSIYKYIPQDEAESSTQDKIEK
ncbi:septation protein A [Thalassotalea psychrophila]|uniref:Inner membrane-spanning protein YciB n=1 Tax=Thalassotalea psychrophila TaxID=3065647 RepID=A0ABY9TZR2_9GAMM|nr:septation protein A [Colwelliaceae bacterium SQ149]